MVHGKDPEWALPSSREPLNYWKLNASSSKAITATNVRFHTQPVRTTVCRERAWPGSRDPRNFFGALNANSSTAVKAIRT